MKCERCQELRLAEDTLTAAERTEMEQHLAECADCRKDAAEEAAILEALRSLPEEDLPAGYHAELMQKLAAEQKILPFAAKKEQPKKQSRWKQMSLMAAAILLVVAAGGMNGILEMRQNHMPTAAQMEAAADTAVQSDGAAELAEASDMAEQAPKAVSGFADENSFGREKAESMPKPMAEEAEIATQDIATAEPFAAARGAVVIQAAERLSLQVDVIADAKADILAQLATLDGYEEPSQAEDLLYVVLPIENVARFREGLQKIGSMEQLESIPAQENDAFRVLEIRLYTK